MARRRCRIASYNQGKLLEMFVAGVPARMAADLAEVNRHSATLFYHKIRQMIAYELGSGLINQDLRHYSYVVWQEVNHADILSTEPITI